MVGKKFPVEEEPYFLELAYLQIGLVVKDRTTG
jgi:hypothetical protein